MHTYSGAEEGSDFSGLKINFEERPTASSSNRTGGHRGAISSNHHSSWAPRCAPVQFLENGTRNLKNSRWADKAFRRLYGKSVDSRLRRRPNRLFSKYAAGSVSDMVTKSVKRKVRGVEKIYWIAAMERTPVLSNYQKGKDK